MNFEDICRFLLEEYLMERSHFTYFLHQSAFSKLFETAVQTALGVSPPDEIDMDALHDLGQTTLRSLGYEPMHRGYVLRPENSRLLQLKHQMSLSEHPVRKELEACGIYLRTYTGQRETMLVESVDDRKVLERILDKYSLEYKSGKEKKK